MQDLGEHLVQQVQRFQQATGESDMVIVIENHDDTMAVHRVGFEPCVGLLVDGKPPSISWYQQAEAFHPLQWPPAVLH